MQVLRRGAANGRAHRPGDPVEALIQEDRGAGPLPLMWLGDAADVATEIV